MTFRTRRTLEAVAVTIGLMLGASVGHAQGYTPSAADQERNRDAAGVFNQSVAGQAALAAGQGYENGSYVVPDQRGALYVACWADVPSHNTAYFSATFVAPTAYSARKEFRELVTTQYGAVSHVKCASKFSKAVMRDIVQQWKDKARATNNAIVETDWAASTATAVAPLNGPNTLTAGR
jgi:hypothetical protein